MARSTLLFLVSIVGAGVPVARPSAQHPRRNGIPRPGLAQRELAQHRSRAGYQPYQNRTDSTQVGKDSTRTDSTGFKYTGPPTDTTLKAQPAAPSGMNAADSVVCKDGSNAGNQGSAACGGHGGVDSAATKAAMKARGWLGKSDSSAAKDSSSSGQKQSP